MFTSSELENYVNEAAHGYLKEAKPLNETITKLASEHGLNRDQIARVVEGANTEVYVQLMNQGTDKYVQFDNASAEKVAEVIFGTEKQAEISTDDYDEEPSEVIVDSEFEKLASVEVQQKTEVEVQKEAIKLAALDDRLSDSLYEVDVRFQNNSNIFYDLVKQAYLGGASFGDIKDAVTMIYDSPVIRKVLEETQEKLAQEIHPKPLDMERRTSGAVNSENSIIKQANLLTRDTQEFLTLREKRAEVIEEMKKLEGTVSIIVREHIKAGAISTPTKLLAGVAVGAIGAAGVHAQMGKVKERDAAMAAKQLSPKYIVR